MTIQKMQENDALLFVIQGRLDTMTAHELESALVEVNSGKLVLDFTQLEYISSAGLRVLLAMNKHLSGKGELIVRNPNDVVREVFDLTGFLDILTIE